MSLSLTWTLVIWMTGIYSGGLTSIDGYTSKEACEAAGEYTELVVTSQTWCVPGPEKQ